MTDWLVPLRHALDALVAPSAFFFRDDDAGWADARLFPLLDVFAVHDVPLDVAVIPQALAPATAAHLRARVAAAPERLGLHTHGFAHVNHEPVGRKCEFGPTRPPGAQRDDLALGRERLLDLLDGAASPFFTPPWNRCVPETGAALVALGYRVLSRDRGARPLAVPGLRELPVAVDWQKRPAEGPPGLEAVAERIAAHTATGEPVGIMLHHARMDAEDCRQLGELLRLLAGHPRAQCASMGALADGGAEPGP